MNRKLRLGMVGGGLGSMIGDIHRYAARMDNHYELVCGAFSRELSKSQTLGAQLGMNTARIYASYKELIATETSLPPEQRMEVVTVATPNDSHYEIAQAALRAGFHVISDKPVTATLEQAKSLLVLQAQSDQLFCVTSTYAGYPMIKEARQRIHAGKFGAVRKVIVEFMQGWLASPVETQGNKQASWRMDAKRNIAGTIADIGPHAFHLAEYVTGLQVVSLSADVNTVIRERELDDDGSIFIKYDNGAPGVLLVSQIAAGEEADVNIRVYTEKGCLKWTHLDPHTLTIHHVDRPIEILKLGRDNKYLHPATLSHCRTPAGHPEAFLEAFANHYRNFALSIKARKHTLPQQPEWNDYPKLEDGTRGVAFIETAIASGVSGQKWIPFPRI